MPLKWIPCAKSIISVDLYRILRFTGLSAFMIIVGCDASDLPRSINAQAGNADGGLLDDSLSGVMPLFVTGREYSDSYSFWQCRLPQSSADEIPIRIWGNGFGALNVESFEWEATDENTLTLMFEDRKVTLNDLSVTETSLSSVSGSEEAVDCVWVGRARASGLDTLFEDAQGDSPTDIVLAFQEALGGPLTCVVNADDNGSTVGFTLSFLDRSIARIDADPWVWQVDESNNLVFTSNSSSKVWSYVSIVNDASGRSLSALENGNRIDCIASSGSAN